MLNGELYEYSPLQNLTTAVQKWSSAPARQQFCINGARLFVAGKQSLVFGKWSLARLSQRE